MRIKGEERRSGETQIRFGDSGVEGGGVGGIRRRNRASQNEGASVKEPSARSRSAGGNGKVLKVSIVVGAVIRTEVPEVLCALRVVLEGVADADDALAVAKEFTHSGIHSPGIPRDPNIRLRMHIGGRIPARGRSFDRAL